MKTIGRVVNNVIKPFIPILAVAMYFGFIYVVDLFSNGIVDTIPELLIENSLFLGFTLALIFIEKKIWKNEVEKVKLNSVLIISIVIAFPGIKLLFDRGIIIAKQFLEMNYTLKYETSDLIFIETVNDIISGIIFAPIIEEMLFRKIPILLFKSKFGKCYAVIGSSLLFAVLHTGQSRFQCIFVGLIFSLIFIVTNNIKITILLHCLMNFMGTICFLLERKIKNIDILSNTGASIYCSVEILVVRCIISTITIYIYLTYGRRRLKRLENESKSEAIL